MNRMSYIYNYSVKPNLFVGNHEQFGGVSTIVVRKMIFFHEELIPITGSK